MRCSQLSLVVIVSLACLTGCQIVVSTPNQYPGQPLPERQLPPQDITVPLLQIYGGRSEQVGWNTYRVRGVFVRPVDVQVVNLSYHYWRSLRTSLRIPSNAQASCVLRSMGYIAEYECLAPPAHIRRYY